MVLRAQCPCERHFKVFTGISFVLTLCRQCPVRAGVRQVLSGGASEVWSHWEAVRSATSDSVMQTPELQLRTCGRFI